MSEPNQLKSYRVKAKLTQKSLGLLCGWEDAQGRISNYEIGTRTPTIQEGYKLVKALNTKGTNCTLYDLFPPIDMQEAS